MDQPVDVDRHSFLPGLLDIVQKSLERGFRLVADGGIFGRNPGRSEEHTSELQPLLCSSYAVFCLYKKSYNMSSHHTQPRIHFIPHCFTNTPSLLTNTLLVSQP